MNILYYINVYFLFYILPSYIYSYICFIVFHYNSFVWYFVITY